MKVHDLIGIGFGPSNLALAIALEERDSEASGTGRGRERFDACFIEKQPRFAWHPDMMLDGTHMQISFLKDLATLRNPTSRYTFINYLHEKERLHDFINLKTFFPSRHEFNDYLAWAAEQFQHCCAYSEEVTEVLPERSGADVTLLRVRSRRADGSAHERLTRHLVVSVGGSPAIPGAFEKLRGDGRVFHSSRYLGMIGQQKPGARIAVIGAGQSATEIFLDLHARPDAPKVDLVMRGRAIKPSDDSPFVNEVFNPDYTDFVYSRPPAERAAMLEEFSNTNYAAPDLALIERMFDTLYQQKVMGSARHRFLRRHEIESVRAAADGIHLTMLDLNAQRESTVRYDAVVLATGYRRDDHLRLLQPLAPYLGAHEVDRHYRLRSTSNFQPAVFLQGACEATHGLSDTLLSITSVRTGEIGSALMAARADAVTERRVSSAPARDAQAWA